MVTHRENTSTDPIPEALMHTKLLVLLFAALIIGFYPSFLRAELHSWEIDKEHTNFYFSVKHIYAEVHGRFTDFKGSFVFNPDNVEESKFSFEIKVKSIDTGLRKRDRHLLSEDFLDAAQYPLITFNSSSISKADQNVYNVKGLLTIKGVSTNVFLPLSYAGTRAHPLLKDTEVTGFNGRLVIDRLDYKVGDGSYYEMGVVGKDVSILLTTELMRKK
jgi:polyisoprenoid-binding protein YceI